MGHDAEAAVGPLRRVAVIDCEDAPKWDGHERFWLDLQRPGESWSVYRAWKNELPATPTSYEALILTGARFSVNDDTQTWLPPLFEFVRACFDTPGGSRLFGACFGLQVITRALGGVVGKNPCGTFVFGSERVELDGFASEWFASGTEPATVYLPSSHGEQALELPAGARVLGRSARTAAEIFAIDDRVLALQFHAELSPSELIHIILPSLRENKRLTDEQEAAALASLDRPLDRPLLLAAVRRFVDGKP